MTLKGSALMSYPLFPWLPVPLMELIPISYWFNLNNIVWIKKYCIRTTEQLLRAIHGGEHNDKLQTVCKIFEVSVQQKLWLALTA